MDEAPMAGDGTTSCRVLLRGLTVMADIGARAHEIGVPQPLVVDVAADVALPTRDELAETVDYAGIAAFAQTLARERIVLIETFADRLARMCLAPGAVTRVEVRVDKPQALPGCLAGVRVVRSRV